MAIEAVETLASNPGSQPEARCPEDPWNSACRLWQPLDADHLGDIGMHLSCLNDFTRCMERW